MAVFLMEVGSARPVHAVQYLFVGLTMVFFYVLLLSLAEHIGFEAAYVAAAGATSGMLALYIAKAQASPLKGLIMLGVLLALYALLYLILRLEDYALLAGAIGGFLALTVVMFATLRVDWSGRKAMAT
jgi:inner membrane protein